MLSGPCGIYISYTVRHTYKGRIMKELENRYMERLSDLYPTIAAASTEIINLQ